MNLNIDGGNDAYLLADDGGVIFGGVTSTTLEVQFSSTSLPSAGGDSDFISYASTSTSGNDVWLGVYDSGTYDLGFGIDNTFVYAAAFDASTLYDGNQHTVSVSWDNASGDYEFFVDGLSIDSGTALKATYTISGGGELVIGMEQDTVGGGFQSFQVFSGTLYDARIFDDVRTAGEIASGHNQTLSRTESGMVGNWIFNDLSLDNVVTEMVSGNNLTVMHAVGTGFTESTPTLSLGVKENSANGTVVGTVTGAAAERDTKIADLLAADPDLTYSAVTGKFYKVVGGPVTWNSAQTAATTTSLSGVNGQLVTIRSAAENQIVHGIAQTLGSNVWIGASDESVEGEWRWYDGTSPSDQFWLGDSSGAATNGEFTNWNGAQPNAGTADDDYAILRQADGRWADRDAATTQAYVVEWDADDVLDQTDALTYSFAFGGDAGGRFAIDADSGQITVANGSLLDFETTASHAITVRITDVDTNTFDQVFTVSLLDTNDAPVLDNSQNLLLDSIRENEPTATNVGNSVLEILNSDTGNPITDPDGSLTGIAITGVDNSNGVWEYSTDGGSDWVVIDPDGAGPTLINDNNALLLEADAGNLNRIRFNPNFGHTGSGGNVDFRAWDGTNAPATSGDYVDVGAIGTGADKPFSTVTEIATLWVNQPPTVSSIADQPIMVNTTTGLSVLPSGTIRMSRMT